MSDLVPYQDGNVELILFSCLLIVITSVAELFDLKHTITFPGVFSVFFLFWGKIAHKHFVLWKKYNKTGRLWNYFMIFGLKSTMRHLVSVKCFVALSMYVPESENVVCSNWIYLCCVVICSAMHRSRAQNASQMKTDTHIYELGQKPIVVVTLVQCKHTHTLTCGSALRIILSHQIFSVDGVVREPI